MKKGVLILALFVGVLAFSGCSLVSSTNTNSNTNTSDLVSDSGPWVGEWSMVSEVVSASAGEIASPATNKIITFEQDGAFLEDYSDLQGLGACDSAIGEYTSNWSADGDVVVVDIPSSIEIEEPYITCGEDAGMTAAPRSIATFSYTGDNWEIEYNSATDMLTATISGPPGAVTQTFTRN